MAFNGIKLRASIIPEVMRVPCHRKSTREQRKPWLSRPKPKGSRSVALLILVQMYHHRIPNCMSPQRTAGLFEHGCPSSLTSLSCFAAVYHAVAQLCMHSGYVGLKMLEHVQMLAVTTCIW